MTATAPVRRFAFALFLLLLAAAPAAHAQDAIPIAEARAQGDGATVTVEGVVTRAFGDFVRFQDASGATGASGLVVRQTSEESAFRQDIGDGTIAPGTQLRVTGTLSEFNGLLQINEDDLGSYEVLGTTEVPTPQTPSLADLEANGEDYESELVQIGSLTFENASGTFAGDTSYDVTDGETTLTLRVQGEDETIIIGTPIPAGSFTYTGIIGQFTFEDPPVGGYQLIPVRADDVTGAAAVAFTGRPYAVALEEDDAVSVTVRAFDFAEGQSASVTAVVSGGTGAADDLDDFDTPTFTLSDTDPTFTLTLDPADDDDDEGAEYVEITLESDDAATAGRFTLWLLDDPTATTTLLADLDGQALLDQLQDDYPSPPTFDYDVARDTLYAVVYNEGGTVRGYYTGFEAALGEGDPSTTLAEAGINAEHTWPQSFGPDVDETPAGADLHILVPARDDVNQERSNYLYGDIPDADTDSWFFEDQTQSTIPADNLDAWSELDSSPDDRDDRRFEPRESVKGDVARKLFYFRAVWPEIADLSFFGPQIGTLLQWNADDPPSAEEVRRNAVIASYQGNTANPFVLDPSLAARAFESGSDGVLPIAEARMQPLGTTVMVEGVVTRIDNDDVTYIQDETAAIAIFDGAVAAGASTGDRLRVTGQTDVFAGALQLSDVGSDGFTVLSSDNALPEAQAVTLAEISADGETYESELTQVDDLAFDDAGGTFAGGTNYAVSDGSEADDVEFRVPSGSPLIGTAIPDEDATFTGVLGQFNGETGDGDTRLPNEGYQLLGLALGDLGAETLTVDLTRTFGDPDAPAGYRLVALPGAADRPLDATIDGAAGTDWQAYWDDGSDEDFFVKFDGSETFDFQPGRGFWLIANDDWTVNTTVPAVERDDDGSYAIPLHESWNIISNPLAEDVDWDAVEAANGGTLQPLWAFTGSYAEAETFASATSGEAFYFLNMGGLDELVIPADGEEDAPVAQSRRDAAQALTLSTYQDGRRTSAAQVGVAPDATDGLDAHDAVAPPGRFEAASLRLPRAGAAEGTRQQWLAAEMRVPGAEGYAFDLVLRAAPGAAVTLRASGLDAFAGQAVHLVEPSTGRTHDLRATPRVDITAGSETTPLHLLVGTAAAGDGQDLLPEAFEVSASYPNPFRNSVTLEYALPEARPVRAVVYDLLGRRVQVLVDEEQTAGPHTLSWDGRDASGQPLASGVYFVRVTAGAETQTHKLVRVR